MSPDGTEPCAQSMASAALGTLFLCVSQGPPKLHWNGGAQGWESASLAFGPCSTAGLWYNFRQLRAPL